MCGDTLRDCPLPVHRVAVPLMFPWASRFCFRFALRRLPGMAARNIITNVPQTFVRAESTRMTRIPISAFLFLILF